MLESLNVDVDEVRAQVARIVGQGDEIAIGQVPFTPRAKKVLELSLREALSLGHNYIGTEHILLGLARENEGLAARILLDFGIDAEQIRTAVTESLSGPGRRFVGPPGPEAAPGWPPEIQVLEEQPGRISRMGMPRRIATYGPSRSPWERLASPLWAGFGLAIGILLGWIIWGLH